MSMGWRNVFQCSWGRSAQFLQWTRVNGCPWNEHICSSAAEGGHLNILQWARVNGCPWDEHTCCYAAENGHLNILQWARANGCPWDERTSSVASLCQHLDILRWARENGCPWLIERQIFSLVLNTATNINSWWMPYTILEESCPSKHLTTDYRRDRLKLLTTNLFHHRTNSCYCLLIIAIIGMFIQRNW